MALGVKSAHPPFCHVSEDLKRHCYTGNIIPPPNADVPPHCCQAERGRDDFSHSKGLFNYRFAS